jgi:GT2 family glycosyltransferase
VIREPHREGFVKAANKGFRAARGRYLMWLNDDARPLPGSLDRAIEQLEFSPRTVGMVALFHPAQTTRNIAYEAQHKGRPFRLLHVRGTLYANFGMASRSLFERLGYFDERYYLNGADPDFSLKVWHAGLSVVPAFGALIDHDELQDDRRDADRDRGAIDNASLFEKWDLPERNPIANDFDQTRPCTLRGLREARAA